MLRQTADLYSVRMKVALLSFADFLRNSYGIFQGFACCFLSINLSFLFFGNFRRRKYLVVIFILNNRVAADGIPVLMKVRHNAFVSHFQSPAGTVSLGG